jgi:hypothetical protein
MMKRGEEVRRRRKGKKQEWLKNLSSSSFDLG